MGKLIDADELKELTCWTFAKPPFSRKTILHMIDMARTVDAVPVRHGKWVFNPSDAFEAMFAKPKCSECGFESADGGNYCPNCGARMDEK